MQCGSFRACTSRTPGIDQVDSHAFEVPQVARSKFRPARRDDAGYLEIADLDTVTRPLALGGDAPGCVGCGSVERLDPSLQVVFNQLLECDLEFAASPASCDQIQTPSDFEQGDRRCPNRLGWLSVQPSHDSGIGRASHQLRDDVGIEDDHLSRSAGRPGWPRASAIASSSPIFANLAEMRVPRPDEAAPSSRTAFRRISRTSSSVLLPCLRARRWSFALTSSSSCRTTI